jgi:hypothetical protein
VHVLAVIFSFVVLVLLILGGLAMGIFKMISNKRGPSARSQEELEETRLMQELHQKMMRMEERIEALETILLEDDRKEDRS